MSLGSTAGRLTGNTSTMRFAHWASLVWLQGTGQGNLERSFRVGVKRVHGGNIDSIVRSIARVDECGSFLASRLAAATIGVVCGIVPPILYTVVPSYQSPELFR